MRKTMVWRWWWCATLSSWTTALVPIGSPPVLRTTAPRVDPTDGSLLLPHKFFGRVAWRNACQRVCRLACFRDARERESVERSPRVLVMRSEKPCRVDIYLRTTRNSTDAGRAAPPRAWRRPRDDPGSAEQCEAWIERDARVRWRYRFAFR